jgi:GT2 family glycosyltransferase/tetratricopeptide (TPR) repeat protein
VKKPVFATAICVHDDWWFLESTIRSFESAGPIFVFVSRVPWNGNPGNWPKCVEVAEAAGATAIVGDWPTERLHREASIKDLLNRSFTHGLLPDSDEIIEPALLSAIKLVATARLAQRVYVEMDTYWKEPDCVIRPRERLAPLLMAELGAVTAMDVSRFNGRLFEGGKPLTLTAEHGVLHHLSYVGPDERITRKLASWSHHDEVVPNWWESVWLKWDEDKLLRNLHPTSPPAYGMVERIPRPEVLREVPNYRQVAEPPASKLKRALPSVSVVIPLYGNSADIHDCLQSLSHAQDLLKEVIVVDNASPDDAAEVARSFPFARVIENTENLGFAKASNQGAEASSGDVVLFLNSDTIVPRVGIVELLRSLYRSGAVAAAGPYSNFAGHNQQLDPTYTTLDNIDLFAHDFTTRAEPDVEVDMLVGFCLAVRRSVLDEVGLFDERFGLGMFEDNDLCYRIRRAGYKLVVSSKSFVHHHGSRTLSRMPVARALFQTNRQAYFSKWREDTATGFAPWLAGVGQGPIVFDAKRQPERLREIAKGPAARARISLCMIVKNEERVLEECLESASPFFSEMIIVDTGSTDRTKEIALRYGAKVLEHPWQDSFSEARNNSIAQAKGEWIFWLDADDTLPISTGEAILKAVLTAPSHVIGFVVPVQFTDDGPNGGTRVDHLKLFRNFSGLEFEGHIHEQILTSLRKHTGEVGRINEPVLHSGYDTSPEGQAKKRERDYKLLRLDLKERPNHPFVLFNMGMTDHFSGQHITAIDWLSKSIKLAEASESHKRKAYALKALSQRALGDCEAACQTIVDGLADVGDDPELRFQYGLILSDMGKLEQAREQYLAMPAPNPNHFSSFDMGILTFKRDHNLGTAYMNLGDYANATECWRRALKTAPDFLHSAIALFDAGLLTGDYLGAEEAMNHVRLVTGPSEDWAQLMAQFEERWRGPEASIRRLREIVDNERIHAGPRLVLSRRLLELGRTQEAMPHLRMLAANGISEAAYCLGVAETRAGRFANALSWIEQALELNPGHQQTSDQVEALRRAIAS